VKSGEFEAKGDLPLFSGVVGHTALQTAVKNIDEVVRRILPQEKRILITTDKDLAACDAVYVQTATTLKHLTQRANDVLGEEEVIETAALGLGLDVVGAAASAFPALLSLMSANRTAQTYASSVDSLAAALAIAGALQDNVSTSVWLNELRLVGGATVLLSAANLDRLRANLAARANDSEAPDSDIRLLLDEVTAFLTSLYAVPADGGRSPIVTAALYERMHQPPREEGEATPDPPEPFTHVLFVHGITASTQQVVDDRPLLFDDKMSVLGMVSIPWALIETQNSAVAAAGVAVGTAQLSGRIGKSFQVDSVKTLG
jgi:hypothetical protein